MSGFEVIGVVLGLLGVLPAAVEAVKGYKSLLSSMKTVERDLRTLIQDLETEQVRLRTTCETLLDGVVPYSIIDTLIESPFGSEWKPYKDQLRLRLWSSSAKFEEHILEMQKAALDLKDKLNIQANGQTSLKDRTSILKELKRNASFTLRKKDYEDIISRIKTSNSILHDLTNQNCGMESSRQRRSQARLIKLMRGLAESLFHAIWNATKCDCVRPHEVCLELVPRKAIILPDDVEDDVAKDFSFYVAFGSHNTPPTDNSSSTLQNQKPRLWNTFDLRMESYEAPMPCPPFACEPIATATPKPLKRVGWSASISSALNSTQPTQTLIDVSKTLIAIPKNTANAQGPISNLCRDILGRQKMAAAGATTCHGYIADSNRNFAVYSRRQPANVVGTITLREMLGEHQERSMDFDYIQKLKAALAIATCVLHLYKTPWLARVVTLDDFVFLWVDMSLMSGPPSPDPPFIAKSVWDVSDKQMHSQQRPVNLTILSLGALLIQVIIGKAMEELDVPGNAELSMNSILTRYEASSRLRDQVLENGGLNYAGAVKWCLDNTFNLINLENERFCQEFYNQVIVRLEEAISYLD